MAELGGQELISFSEYARRRGVSQPYISKLVAEKKIPVFDGKKIDPAIADASLARFRDPAQANAGANAKRLRDSAGGLEGAAPGARGEPGGRPGSDTGSSAGGPTYTQVATARLGYQAQRAKLAYERERGELVESARLEEGIETAFVALRDAVQGIPDRLAGQIGGTTEDQRRVRTLLATELNRTLADLADTMQAMAGSQRTETRQ